MERDTIILIDKPKGISSFAVVQRVRRAYNEKKVGHAGTLDPLASGLMLVGIGKGTKQLRHLVGLTKVYEAEICIGEQSTTDDAEGEIVGKTPITNIDEEAVQSCLKSLEGKHVLPVSIYSAVKRGGEALYKKARRGEKVTPPQREMEIFQAKFLGIEKRGDTVLVRAEFFVESGTYIRSLARELGNRLGYPARLENLRRTQVGEFHIKDASTV